MAFLLVELMVALLAVQMVGLTVAYLAAQMVVRLVFEWAVMTVEKVATLVVQMAS